MITADGRPVGYLCWQEPTPSELENAGLGDLCEDLVDIDILIGEQEYLGCGIGPRALVLLVAELRSEGVRLAGLGTSTSNKAAIRAFEKAGFRLHSEFDDPGFGPSEYMVMHLSGAVGNPDVMAGERLPGLDIHHRPAGEDRMRERVGRIAAEERKEGQGPGKGSRDT